MRKKNQPVCTGLNTNLICFFFLFLVHPFRGKFYQKNDPSAPSLKRFTGQTILLTLPDSVEVGDLKWLSVWSRLFRDNFGDFIFEDQDDNSEESFEVTTSRIGKC